MQSRTFCFVVAFVGYATFVFVFATPLLEPNSTSLSRGKDIECWNSKYRNHIKCMSKRKRRHYPHPPIDNLESSCLENCRSRCESSYDCDKKCNYCISKTKHRHQIITEYENDCENSECKKNRDETLKSINVTTKIDIHNVIEGSPGVAGGGGGGGGSPSIPVSNKTCCPTCEPPIKCQPIPIYYIPQPMPMGNMWGGGACQHPSMWWLCHSYRQPSFDCSECIPPYTSYQCHMSCPTYQHNNGPCVSPYCVGAFPQHLQPTRNKEEKLLYELKKPITFNTHQYFFTPPSLTTSQSFSTNSDEAVKKQLYQQ
ncbi:hypothetical protein WH47_09236 [Habropoda laboriosa]|uniref:Uncharacterized protein n=1 Tax=Habropoda laboriosa TaxID=597456 RepID=A0A0L7R8Z4_9HYME|nr:hypothetical protein WH47_09236 [Habropoda laboriosa]